MLQAGAPAEPGLARDWSLPCGDRGDRRRGSQCGEACGAGGCGEVGPAHHRRAAHGEVAPLEKALDTFVVSSRAAQRVRALEGRAPRWLDVLRRKVALHANAKGVDISAADVSALRRVQRGSRLEVESSTAFAEVSELAAGTPREWTDGRNDLDVDMAMYVEDIRGEVSEVGGERQAEGVAAGGLGGSHMQASTVEMTVDGQSPEQDIQAQ
ncbi:unnamed protein product [Prorocentrum cordatum]|uniref:Uncharacterized protein n=1 Tax=Prorocentrum cordatum TaxID=2364126 RepID=A0ABN9QU72_9DINO|nr:unnamed protein product [Polarella glacialis]